MLCSPLWIACWSLCGQVIPGATSAVGLRGDAFMEAVISITTNDDERPDPTVEDDVIKSLLTAGASDCKELASQVSTRLSVPDARVKIKTLQLILTCLTSKHRTAVRNQHADRCTRLLCCATRVWNTLATWGCESRRRLVHY
jgi:hypothetical protein